MEISRHKSSDLLTLRLAGRLDANWCGSVEEALSEAVKDGEHQIHLDMHGVAYMSSAGLRVLLTFYKQLRGISGLLSVVNPSPVVRTVLDLSGLGMLIGSAAVGPMEAGEAVLPTDVSRVSARAAWKAYPLSSPASFMRLALTGNASVLAGDSAAPPASARAFGEGSIALGVGALGAADSDHLLRSGEFLAVGGVAVFQPADGSSNRPDFMVTEGSLAPQGKLLLGITGEGGFAKLMRFEATDEARTVGLTELAQNALQESGATVAVVVGITETAGLVGASLRRSPGVPAAVPSSLSQDSASLGARFAFPEIRDWLSFTSERSFRDTTSLFVGVVAQPGSPFDPLLRPLARGSGLVGHFHAAVFPYRPLRKGHIDLKSSVAALFEGLAPQAVLHLLSDPRGISGAGESEFLRGALWLAPVVSS